MAKHGSEDQYNKNLINGFKNGDEPEIIIVVDKLLTGFDAPRNTVLYLTRQLKDHTLLQAIARVNRLYEGKDFGYIIDYRGVLTESQQSIRPLRQAGGIRPSRPRHDADRCCRGDRPASATALRPLGCFQGDQEQVGRRTVRTAAGR